MENFPTDSDLKILVKELSEGRELAAQLRGHLNVQSSSHETRDFLIHRILHSYDQALAVLNYGCSGGGGAGEAPPEVTAVGTSESPRSLVRSPPSDDSDQDVKVQGSRKRKAEPSSKRTIKVSLETGIEGQLDDGYNWRKYGQKDILGAKHPRGYYRCSHRHGQGCLATKYVQKSDEDPTVFEITYKRTHTCNPRANPNNPQLDPQNEASNPLPGSDQNQPLFNIQTSLRSPNENPPFGPFNFPSSSGMINPQNDDSYGGLVSNYGDYSNYYPISTNALNITSESELGPVVAPMTSASNSPTVGTSLPFGSSEFRSDFGFGDPGHYP